MPRTEIQLEKVRADASAKLVNAALELFAKQGFHGASIDAIARRAKVSKGLAYNYFDDKEALLEAVVARVIAERLRLTLAIWHDAVTQPSPVKAIHTVIGRYLDEAAAQRESFRLYFTLFLQNEAEKATRRAIKAEADGLAELARLEDELLAKIGSQNIRLDVALLRTTLDGIVARHITMPDLFALAEMRKHLIAHYIARFGLAD